MRAPIPTRPRFTALGLSEPKPQRSPSLARRPLIAAALLILVGLVDRAGAGLAGPALPPPPIQASSLRWLAIADSGSGDANQRAVANQMVKVQQSRPVDLVLMAGDNIYPDGNLNRVEATFLRPYRALLEAKVPFHAVLGNHDIRTGNGEPQMAYPPFGMKGRWYTLRRGPVEFFMLDTNMNARWQHQLPWLRRVLAASSGFYGNDPAAIARLTPLFRQHGVQLYINGHEHHYERSRVIDGTTYLQVGGAGAALRAVVPADHSARALSRHSFAELSATATTLQVTGWDDRGQRIDSAVLNR
jgi:predicted phosphodiesterase